MKFVLASGRWVVVAVLFWLIGAAGAQAHEVRPALLQATETAPGSYDVMWKQPVVGDMAVRMIPHLSSGVLDRAPDTQTVTPGFLVRTWRVRGGQPLDGQTLRIEGLSQTVTDVLVRVSPAKGAEINAVIRPANPEMKLVLSGPHGIATPAYLALGVEHILTGFDHLLFVLGLLLLVGPNWGVVKAVSAFTVAHSITLALAALGYIHFPSAIIEALVALSIVFVACELAPRRDGMTTLTRTYPWIIAFLFGLLHGLAFAGSLAQIGLPPHAAPMALFLFNVGVELGQLMFISAVLLLMVGVRRAQPWLKLDLPALSRIPPYVIGGLGAYWLIDRLVIAYA